MPRRQRLRGGVRHAAAVPGVPAELDLGGLGNVNALDVLRALGREPEVLEAWLTEVGLAQGEDPRLDRAIEGVLTMLADTTTLEVSARRRRGNAACLQASLLVRFAPRPSPTPSAPPASAATTTARSAPSPSARTCGRSSTAPPPSWGGRAPRHADTSSPSGCSRSVDVVRTGLASACRAIGHCSRGACASSFDKIRCRGEGGVVSPIVTFVTQQGGFCTRAEALAATSEAEVGRALRCGEIVWLSRGRYGLPELDRDVAVAHGLNAVLSHLSAALWHGWEVKTVPVTHVTVPRRRHRAYEVPAVTRPPAGPGKAGIATSSEQTLLDCLRRLAVAVADSALRHGCRARCYVSSRRRCVDPGARR